MQTNTDHVDAIRGYSSRLKAHCLGEGVTAANVAEKLGSLQLQITMFHDKTWDSWIEKNTGPLLLSGADLSDLWVRHVKFIDADLEKANCEGTWFFDCHFKGANMASANFQKAMILNMIPGSHDGAECQKCNFAGATFFRARLQGVNCQGADFSGATIDGVGVDDNTDFTDANFAECKLKGQPDGVDRFLQRLTPEQRNMIQVERESSSGKPAGKQGCFIATACYGNYEAPEVMALRRFRDEALLRAPLGRWLVARYYQVSPSIARQLCRHPVAARSIRRIVLDPLTAVIRRNQE